MIYGDFFDCAPAAGSAVNVVAEQSANDLAGGGGIIVVVTGGDIDGVAAAGEVLISDLSIHIHSSSVCVYYRGTSGKCPAIFQSFLEHNRISSNLQETKRYNNLQEISRIPLDTNGLAVVKSAPAGGHRRPGWHASCISNNRANPPRRRLDENDSHSHPPGRGQVDENDSHLPGRPRLRHSRAVSPNHPAMPQPI